MRRRGTIVAVIAATMVLGAAPAAMAAPPDQSGAVTRESLPIGLVYEEDGIYVVGGPPFEQGCRDQGFAEPTFSFVNRGDGGQNVRFTYKGERIMVFEGDYPNVFALIGEACAAVLDDDPSTNPPEPIAIGTGRYSLNERIDRDGTLYGHNSLVGKVTTNDGRRVHLSAFAKYLIDETGLNLQQLRVDYGG